MECEVIVKLNSLTVCDDDLSSDIQWEEFDDFCWIDISIQYFWPFNDTYAVRIIQDFVCSDTHEIRGFFYSIEIKMVYVAILLIICICWRRDDEFWILEKMSDECLCKGGFSCTQISLEKYPITFLERKNNVTYVFEGQNSTLF